MHIVDQLKEKAKAIQARIVLPEGDDPRVQEAARQLVGIVRPILIARPDQLLEPMPDGVTVIDPNDDANSAEFAQPYYELRKHKGVTIEQAAKAVTDPIVLGAMMVKTGSAEGCVAGATHATRDVLRAALQIIGVAPGFNIVSSTFLMILPDGRPLTYGDCGMVPNPNAEQLSEIAIASANTFQQLTGQTPAVAMLSFSTKGSASHPDVTKVVDATALAQAAAPDIAIDGELQFDAALLSSIGSRKAPDSQVAGQANVFIFPTLDAGNIAYKITERLGNAQAIGPIIQGLAKPMHDLSRGCKAEDIAVLSMISAIQSGEVASE